ncbi:lipocalin-15 [Dromiciops gliroides]|uniref:lipocalin-15 n=1 Tax=Dromiciops gliroides TaxID=33562 RepID=UPI001CC7A2F6|nr:lipocalin-15 [Dromiciops gliroides]
MKVILLSSLLGLLCVSLVHTDVLVQPDFDAKQFSGLWYVVSMVSDCKVFLGKKENILMSTRFINATEDGNLSVHMALPRADGCKTMDAEYMKIGSEGHYKVPASGYLDVRVAETDYKSYCILYIYKELDGVLSTMVQLFSRTQDVHAKALRAFQDFYPIVGLEDDMMSILSKSGKSLEKPSSVTNRENMISKESQILEYFLETPSGEFFTFLLYDPAFGVLPGIFPSVLNK